MILDTPFFSYDPTAIKRGTGKKGTFISRGSTGVGGTTNSVSESLSVY